MKADPFTELRESAGRSAVLDTGFPHPGLKWRPGHSKAPSLQRGRGKEEVQENELFYQGEELAVSRHPCSDLIGRHVVTCTSLAAARESGKCSVWLGQPRGHIQLRVLLPKEEKRMDFEGQVAAPATGEYCHRVRPTPYQPSPALPFNSCIIFGKLLDFSVL